MNRVDIIGSWRQSRPQWLSQIWAKIPPFRQRWTNYRITCVIQTFLALWNLTCPERQCWKRLDLYLENVRKTKRSAESSRGGVCSNVYVVFETFLDVTQWSEEAHRSPFTHRTTSVTCWLDHTTACSPARFFTMGFYYTWEISLTSM